MRGLFFNAQPTTDVINHPSGFDREYDNDDFNRYMGVFFSNGVFVRNDPDACKVTASGLRLDVTPGIALLDGGQCHFEAGDGLTISQGDGLYSVMCRRNNAAAVRAFGLAAIKGAEAYPAPVREGDIYDLCLAHVQVAGGVATVTDTREDGELCGFAALTGQPPYYPPDEANLPYILWLYILGLPMTPEQVAAVESNPSLMEIFNNSRLTPATKEEAEAGVDNSKLMTPKRTKEAIEANVVFAVGNNGKKYKLGVANKIAAGFTALDGGFTIAPLADRKTPKVETENFYAYAKTGAGYALGFFRKDGTGVETTLTTSSTYTCIGLSPIPGDKVYAVYTTGSTWKADKVVLFDLNLKTFKTITTNPTQANNTGAFTRGIIGVDETTFWAFDYGNQNNSNDWVFSLALYTNEVKGVSLAMSSEYYYRDADYLYFFGKSGSQWQFKKINIRTGVVLASVLLPAIAGYVSWCGNVFTVKDNIAYMLAKPYSSSGSSFQVQFLTIDLTTMTILWQSSIESVTEANGMVIGSFIGMYDGYLYVSYSATSQVSRIYTINEDWSWSVFSTPPAGLPTDPLYKNLGGVPITTSGIPGYCSPQAFGGMVTDRFVRSIPMGTVIADIATEQTWPNTSPILGTPFFVNEDVVALTNDVIFGVKSPKKKEIRYVEEVD